MGIHHWEFPSGNIFTKGIWSGQGQENGGQFPMNDLEEEESPTVNVMAGKPENWWPLRRTFPFLNGHLLGYRIFCSHGGNCSPEGGPLWTRTRLPFCTCATLLLSEVLEASDVEGAFRKSKNIISGAERGLCCYSKSPRIYEPNYKLHLAICLLVMNFSGWKIK